MVGWMDRQMDEWKDGQMDGWVDDGLTDDRQMDGWMDGWWINQLRANEVPNASVTACPAIMKHHKTNE